MENIGDFGCPALDFKDQPLHAKATVEMKGGDAKVAFFREISRT